MLRQRSRFFVHILFIKINILDLFYGSRPGDSSSSERTANEKNASRKSCSSSHGFLKNKNHVLNKF